MYRSIQERLKQENETLKSFERCRKETKFKF